MWTGNQPDCQGDNVYQFGPNAYSKPVAILHARQTIMGPELFDYALNLCAEMETCIHPADFFRSMEDASAMD